jgi:hypothetical protein
MAQGPYDSQETEAERLRREASEPAPPSLGEIMGLFLKWADRNLFLLWIGIGLVILAGRIILLALGIQH